MANRRTFWNDSLADGTGNDLCEGFDHDNSCPGTPITNKGGMGMNDEKKVQNAQKRIGQPKTDCIAGTAAPENLLHRHNAAKLR